MLHTAMSSHWDLLMLTRVQKQTVISVSVSLVRERGRKKNICHSLMKDEWGFNSGMLERWRGLSVTWGIGVDPVQWLKHLKKQREQRTVFWYEESPPWAAPCSGMEMASENRNRSCDIIWKTWIRVRQSFSIFLVAFWGCHLYFCSPARVPHPSHLSFCTESWPKTGKECQVTLHC